MKLYEQLSGTDKIVAIEDAIEHLSDDELIDAWNAGISYRGSNPVDIPSYITKMSKSKVNRVLRSYDAYDILKMKASFSLDDEYFWFDATEQLFSGDIDDTPIDIDELASMIENFITDNYPGIDFSNKKEVSRVVKEFSR